MNDADKKAFDKWCKKVPGGHLFYHMQADAWQAACEWRDSQVGEPYAYIYEFNSNVFGVHRSFSSNQWNGMQPTRVVKVFTAPPAAQINQQLIEALEGVIRVADRATIEFDVARAAIAKAKGEQTK